MFGSSCTWMKTSKALTVSVSIFRGRISWHFSLSKKLYFSSCFRFGAHIVSTVILTSYERTHKETTRQSVWNGFYWQSKIRPPFAHHLALSHIYIQWYIYICSLQSWNWLVFRIEQLKMGISKMSTNSRSAQITCSIQELCRVQSWNVVHWTLEYNCYVVQPIYFMNIAVTEGNKLFLVEFALLFKYGWEEIIVKQFCWHDRCR